MQELVAELHYWPVLQVADPQVHEEPAGEEYPSGQED